MKPLDKMVWVDVETTGLDAVNDTILEVGVIITRGTDFEEITSANWVVALPKSKALHDVHQRIFEMHGKSGLLAECAGSALTEDSAAEQIYRFIRSATNYTYDGPICGSSPHGVDLPFLAYRMPNVRALFNYRVFDVSTLRQAFVNIIQMEGEAPAVDEDNNQHRALADLRWSIAKAKNFFHFLKKGMYT